MIPVPPVDVDALRLAVGKSQRERAERDPLRASKTLADPGFKGIGFARLPLDLRLRLAVGNKISKGFRRRVLYPLCRPPNDLGIWVELCRPWLMAVHQVAEEATASGLAWQPVAC